MIPKGRVFEVQHLALYDGPGIRTVIYLKGCPLRCIWCHNPEGLHSETELFFHKEKCSFCGRCAGICLNGAHIFLGHAHHFLREKCCRCCRCAQICPSMALENTGVEVTVEEMLQEILCDSAFYRDEGGVTLSGGEPLAQGNFSCELLRAAKECGINTCIETSGYAPEHIVRNAADVTDLFLFDIKEVDSDKHREFTGVENTIILSNLCLLDSLQKEVILRCPIIPEKNLNITHFKAIAGLAEQFVCVKAVELEPYHPLGLSKYESLGQEPNYTRREYLDPAVLAPYVATMRQITHKPVRLGNGEMV